MTLVRHRCRSHLSSADREPAYDTISTLAPVRALDAIYVAFDVEGRLDVTPKSWKQLPVPYTKTSSPTLIRWGRKLAAS